MPYYQLTLGITTSRHYELKPGSLLGLTIELHNSDTKRYDEYNVKINEPDPPNR
jgi:hypothetical protein